MIHETYLKAAHNLLNSLNYMTATHCIRVSSRSFEIATNLGLSQERCEWAELGGILHDQGKRAIVSDILLKDEKLTKGEWLLVKSHPLIGAELIDADPIKFPPIVRAIALQHHERLDGSGYPYGLRGEQIAVESQIVTVADTIDAMLHRRPYHNEIITKRHIIPELEALAGNKLSADVVAAALKTL